MWPDPAAVPLERKEFNKHLDALIETSQLNPDILPYLDSAQQYVMNEVKKSLVRLTKKYGEKLTGQGN